MQGSIQPLVPVEKSGLPNAEAGQSVVVERNAAREPAEGEFLAAKPLKLARGADALGRRIKPKRQQNARIDRRVARLALNRFDCRVKRRKIVNAQTVRAR